VVPAQPSAAEHRMGAAGSPGLASPGVSGRQRAGQPFRWVPGGL